jgi:hypothetical protein
VVVKKEILLQQQQVIKNAVAVLNGDLGEEARRGFLRFLKAQQRAEVRRAQRLKLIVGELLKAHFSEKLEMRRNAGSTN